MPGAGQITTAHSPRALRTPLSAKEMEHARRTAARLHAELRAVVLALPESARFASGMSRYLDVVRPTCQRIVNVLQDGEPDAEALVRLPGVKGLQQFLDACRRHAVEPRLVDLAEAAVRQFDAFLESIGGSQRRLAARLDAAGDPAATATGDEVAHRAALFECAARVTGRSCHTSLSMYVFRSNPPASDELQRALVHGSTGNVIRPGGMPMVLTSGNTLRFDQPDGPARLLDDAPALGRTTSAILEPFTTHPLPEVTSRGDHDKLVQVIDPEVLEDHAVLDVFLGERSTHPLYDDHGKPTLDEVWTLVNCPTRHLIFEVYLEDDLERSYRPSIDTQLWYPNLSSPGNDRWITRFPGRPQLQVLGRGFPETFSAAYPRHAELTRYFFDRIGVDPRRCFGFRCEVAWPIWRAGYRMSFEHIPRSSISRP